jgi:hypothetical protein
MSRANENSRAMGGIDIGQESSVPTRSRKSIVEVLKVLEGPIIGNPWFLPSSLHILCDKKEEVESFESTLYRKSQPREKLEISSWPPRHGCLGIKSFMYNGVHIAMG